MIEEPYRWMEAIANRREYIETQLGSGSPLAAVSYRDGILFLTVGRARQKVFEIYDRIAMGAIGHPGDIERLRMAAIELASTEGFTRSAADVSLRRLAYYSLSPLLKGAFEQIFGAPYLARMLFAEIGTKPADDLFLRVEYDGSIVTNAGTLGQARRDFGVLSGTKHSTEMMESFLQNAHDGGATFERALRTALDAWSVGRLVAGEEAKQEMPAREQIAAHRQSELATASIEAAILDRTARTAIRYRALDANEVRSAAGDSG
jgi:proteasome alpha subunit